MNAFGRFLLAVLAWCLLWSAPALGRGEAPGATAAQEIGVAELPREARETLTLIRSGGPFSYERDGIEFRNFEKRLPLKPRGYYREYTVTTPGARDRGARRIIAGRQGEYYYTGDHYASFKRIRE